MNKNEYEKPEVKVLEMQDLMDGDGGEDIWAHTSVHEPGEGGAKENEFEDEEDEDTTSASWGIY